MQITHFFFKYDGYLSVFIQVWKPLYYKKFCIFFVCLTGYGPQCVSGRNRLLDAVYILLRSDLRVSFEDILLFLRGIVVGCLMRKKRPEENKKMT
ncbi:hypothetical protein NSB1T_08535 [Coprobacter fastidiosus NSB1 = JCM 33896]|nr:hypothetical protein NSB1T_08535 [Coprobacter fastidiosus NSB1 = JCM 33896]